MAVGAGAIRTAGTLLLLLLLGAITGRRGAEPAASNSEEAEGTSGGVPLSRCATGRGVPMSSPSLCSFAASLPSLLKVGTAAAAEAVEGASGPIAWPAVIISGLMMDSNPAVWRLFMSSSKASR